MTHPYERIGTGYARRRTPDPRIHARIEAALGDAQTVCNVGAGTGNYEPLNRSVIACEPAWTMIKQRAGVAGPCVRAIAEAAPFRDDSFDAAMAIMTIQHWRDPDAGLREMRRIARRCIIYLAEPIDSGWMWLADEYFPEMYGLMANRHTPGAEAVAAMLGGRATIEVVPVPADMAEPSGAAFWNRPERYCDPDAQASMSIFALLDPAVAERGTVALREDLASGRWDRLFGQLRAQTECDLGYRLITTQPD